MIQVRITNSVASVAFSLVMFQIVKRETLAFHDNFQIARGVDMADGLIRRDQICLYTAPVADETVWHKCVSAPLFAKVSGKQASAIALIAVV